MQYGSQSFTPPGAYDPATVEDFIVTSGNATIATTGNTDLLVTIPTLPSGVKWELVNADFSSTDALATDNTNYVTFSITNKSNSDAAMLAATAANTTKTTGGSALAAYTRRALTLNGTPANLRVDSADVLLVRAAASGTLAGAVTNANVTLTFRRKVNV